MPMNNPEEYLKLLDQIKADRKNYDSTWQDLAKYCIPRKAYITRVKTPGRKFDPDVYDSTAMQSTLVLAAGLHSYLTNPATRWFTLDVEDPKLRNEAEVKKWLRHAEDEIYFAFNHSNFSEQIHENYIDLGVFGTGFLYEEEDERDRVRFYSRPVQECYLLESEKGRVDTVFRDFKLTVKQAHEKWGDNAGKDVVKAMEKQDYSKTQRYVHLVEPRHERDPSKEDALNMPFASYYIHPDEKRVITESGYVEFPYMVPRFNKVSGDPYGTSPALVSYADIRMLNLMDKTIIRAAQKIVDPPLVLPHDGYLLPIKLGPAAINYRVRGNADDKIEPLVTKANIPVGLEMEEVRRIIIKRNFFVDLFLVLSDPINKEMTATEVLQRVEEKMLILAPTLGRLMSELLDPLIGRTFNILSRLGHIVPPPTALEDGDYKIIYTSPLARSQRFEEMKAINAVMAIVGNVAAIAPSVLDKINTDNFIDIVADIYNVKPELINDDKEVKKIREARAAAQAEAAKAAKAQQTVETLKTGAEASAKIKESQSGSEG